MTEEIKLNSTEKSIMILNAFIPLNQEMGTRELSRKLGLSSSTVSRILQDFLKYDIVQRNTQNNKYQLGIGMLLLGNSVNQSFAKNNVLQVAEPYLVKLNQTTKENVGFVVLSRERMIIMRELDSPLRIKPVSHSVGSEPSWHCSASSRAMLSFSGEELQRKFFKRKREKFTSKTITDLKTLKKQLIQIRETGVSFDYGEKFDDVWAVASPIFNHKSQPIAAVGTYGPAFRIKDRLEGELTELTKKTARHISLCLSYQPPSAD